MNAGSNIYLLEDMFFATTQLNSTQSWVGLIFLRNHNHKTVSHFISAPTQSNSTKFSMQPYFNPTRRFMPKKLVQPPPRKKSKIKNQNLILNKCHLISTSTTQLEDAGQKKLGQPLPPQKKSKFKIWFWTNSKLNSTKFSMPPYFNLN